MAGAKGRTMGPGPGPRAMWLGRRGHAPLSRGQGSHRPGPWGKDPGAGTMGPGPWGPGPCVTICCYFLAWLTLACLACLALARHGSPLWPDHCFGNSNNNPATKVIQLLSWRPCTNRSGQRGEPGRAEARQAKQAKARQARK